MRKIFLTTTILLTAGTALAFGGVFNHGSKSTTYKGGVDAIGVHFGREKSGEVSLNCPEHSEWSDDENACLCESGWTMNNAVCMPKGPTTCAANGFYWCASSQVCVTDEAACLALCPSERLCGQTCCGEGNLCVNGNKCCYGGNADKCCNASESTGWIGDIADGHVWSEGCCDLNSTPYLGYTEDEYMIGTGCCPNDLQIFSNQDIYSIYPEYYPQFCCAEGSTDHNPTDGGCCEPGNIFLQIINSDGFCVDPDDLKEGTYSAWGEDILIYQNEGHYFGCFPEVPIFLIDENGRARCCPEGATTVTEECW